MTSKKIIASNFADLELRTLAYTLSTIVGYVEKRSKVSSRHKLPDVNEILATVCVRMAFEFDGAGTIDKATLQRIIDLLVADGKLIAYDHVYSTRRIDVL